MNTKVIADDDDDVVSAIMGFVVFSPPLTPNVDSFTCLRIRFTEEVMFKGFMMRYICVLLH